MTESVFSAGGWCGPSELLHQLDTVPERIDLPQFSVQRGGILFEYRESTPEEMAFRSVMRKLARQQMEARDRLIDDACAVGLANGWDTHVYEHPELSWAHSTVDKVTYSMHTGTHFKPSKYAVPTLTIHERVDATFDEDEDWADA